MSSGSYDPVRQAGRFRTAFLVLTPVAVLLWASWPAFCGMAERWSTDPRYAHGYLVPVFSLFLLWHRRAMVDVTRWSSNWWGLVPILIGSALQLTGGFFFFGYLEAVAILPIVAGTAMMLGGWEAIRWAWPAIAFLGFMLPLPYRVEMTLAGPLQRVATLMSTYTLQTVGFAAVSEGNVIHLDGGPIEIVEACGGLGMLFTFMAMAAGVAILVSGMWIDRVMILAGALPIALIANVARITATGIMHELVRSRVANAVFHDFAGWLMMPLALGLMALELAVLKRVLVPAVRPADVPAGPRKPGRGEGGYQPEGLSSTEEVIKRALGAR